MGVDGAVVNVVVVVARAGEAVDVDLVAVEEAGVGVDGAVVDVGLVVVALGAKVLVGPEDVAGGVDDVELVFVLEGVVPANIEVVEVVELEVDVEVAEEVDEPVDVEDAVGVEVVKLRGSLQGPLLQEGCREHELH